MAGPIAKRAPAPRTSRPIISGRLKRIDYNYRGPRADSAAFAQRHEDGAVVAPDQQQGDFFARRPIERATPTLEILHRLPIDLQDYVAGPQSGRRPGAARIDLRHQHSGGV